MARTIDASAEPSRAVGDVRRFDLEELDAALILERLRQFCLAIFEGDQPVRSLGFTSALSGEGKSTLATIAAGILANDFDRPVTLVECNWEHPTLHKFFGIGEGPGLVELLRDECTENEVRYRVQDNLTVIPAGQAATKARHEAVRLQRRLRQEYLPQWFLRSQELFIMELPPVATCGYGAAAAALVEALVIVVRAGATPDDVLADTCQRLADYPVRGLLLNEVQSHIPRWLRRLL